MLPPAWGLFAPVFALGGKNSRWSPTFCSPQQKLPQVSDFLLSAAKTLASRRLFALRSKNSRRSPTFALDSKNSRRSPTFCSAQQKLSQVSDFLLCAAKTPAGYRLFTLRSKNSSRSPTFCSQQQKLQPVADFLLFRAQKQGARAKLSLRRDCHAPHSSRAPTISTSCWRPQTQRPLSSSPACAAAVSPACCGS